VLTVLRPRVEAREFVAEESYRFDARIALPLVGPLIRYDGGVRTTASV
jgi:hypothetical protein